ncbi:MAG TPA: hypothetical protein VF126_02675 [Acidobacteriaceae bacterium]|jgi:hypothetical protein
MAFEALFVYNKVAGKELALKRCKQGGEKIGVQPALDDESMRVASRITEKFFTCVKRKKNNFRQALGGNQLSRNLYSVHLGH